MTEQEKRIRITIEGNAEGANSALKDVGSGLQNIFEIAAGIATSQVLAQVFDQIVTSVGSLFTAAVEEESVMTLLEQGVEHLGDKAAFTVPQLVDLATQLGQTTKFSQDLYLESENLLMRFTAIGTETFPRVIQSAADLATVTGTDLPNAVKMLGRTLEDPVAGMASLRRMNIVLSDAQKEQIKTLSEQGDMMGAQAVILDAIDAAYGGAAQTMGGTFAGQQAILKNNTEQLSEVLGGALLPLMTGLNKTLNVIATNPAIIAFFENLGAKMTTALEPLAKLTDTFIAGFGSGGIAGGLTAVFEPMTGSLSNFISILNGGALGTGIASLKSFFSGDWSGPLQATQATIAKYAEYLKFLFTTIGDFVTQNIVPFLVAQFEKITAWMNENKPLIQQFIVVINQIVQAIITGLEWLVPKILGLWTVVSPILNGIVDLVLNDVKILMQIFTGDWAGAWETAKAAVVNAGKAILDAVVALLEWIAGLFGSSLKEIATTWIGVWDAMKTTVTLVWGIIKSAVTDAWNGIVNFFTGAWNTFRTYWSDQWNAMVLVVTTIGKILVTNASTVITNLWNGIKGVWTTISTWWGNVWNALVAVVTGIGTSLYSAGANIIQGLWDGMLSLWNDLTDWWNTSVTDLIDKAKAILGIASPSQAFSEIGQHIINGLIGGLGKNIQIPVEMIGDLGKNMAGAMAVSSNSSASYTFTNYISGSDPRGVVDELMHRFRLQGLKFSEA